MSGIGPARLDERLSDEDDPVFVLDVRPADDYEADHVPGSHSAPVYHDLQQGDVDALAPHLDAVPGDAAVVTVCKAGVVARRATTYLNDEGYTARTLTGGYAGWRQYEENTVLYRLAALLRRVVP
jgi:rhodanese-related sulfurtransferase